MSETKDQSWLGKIMGRDAEPAPATPGQALTARMVQATETFHTLRVEDVMVPRADIIAVEADCGLHDLAKAFEGAGHSRLPVYNGTLDDPAGFVHVKDILPYLMLNARGRTAKSYRDRRVIKSIRRAVLFVPASMLARDLLRRMQVRRIHMAVVVDEYGGTDGLVTLEDLLEPIVGDIEDEHDDGEPAVETVGTVNGANIYEADARISIDDFEEALGREFATPDEEDDVDTLGGLVFTLAGRVPERGEIIRHPDGVEFEIVDADPRRVKRLRIRSKSAKKPAPVPVAPTPASGT